MGKIVSFALGSKVLRCGVLISLLLSLSTILVAQGKVAGTVTGTNNLPLGGATIENTITGLTTLSDKAGSFSIPAKKGDVIKVSFVGYILQQVEVGSNNFITIQLKESFVNLDAIVLLGYTSQRIKEETGSIAVVKPKELVAVPAGQLESMLQGRVAGLTVIGSGEPGAPVNVRLHGIGNFGDVTPLYIVDGVEMPNIDNLNPYDIESIQVLKDAGTYSVYGVRGANGVVVITTRKGNSGKTKITYDGYIGLQEPLKHGLDLLNPQEQADLIWIALKNSGYTAANGNPSTPAYGNGPTPVLPDYAFPLGAHTGDPGTNPALYNNDPRQGPLYPIAYFNKTGTDWFHESFKPAFSQSHTISASGGNDKNIYLLSLGYLDQEGTFMNDYLKRFTVRVNTQFSALDAIRIGENLQLNANQNPRLFNSIGNSALTTDPAMPVYDIKGNYLPAYDNGDATYANPVYEAALLKDDKQNNWEAFGNAYIEADFLKKFTFRSSFGGTLDYNYGYSYSYGGYQQGLATFQSMFGENSGYSQSWTWTNVVNFASSFLKDHHIKVLAGTEEKSNYSRSVGGTRIGYFTNDPSFFTLSSGNPIGQNNYSMASSSYLSSFISQAEYNYKEKYFLSGTVRRDASSIFGPDSREGWFPAVAAAWRLNQENFMKAATGITELKLRGSWGKTGFYGNTDPLNQFNLYGSSASNSYYDIYGISSGAIQQGFARVRIGNAHTGWQQDVVGNLGVDGIFWKGKLSVTADLYNKDSRGLLFPAPIPAFLGVDAVPPNVNIGDVRNKGVDLLVGSKGKFSKNWNWDVTVTLSSYKNKIVKLNGAPFIEDLYDIQGAGALVRDEVGYPVGSFYGYKIIGLFANQNDVNKSPAQPDAAPGRFKYLDANGDGVIDQNDEIHYGNPNPKFTSGLNIGLNYRNFDFSTFMYGSFGNDVLNDVAYSTDIFVSELFPNQKSKTALYNSWTPNRLNAKAPLQENSINFSNSGVVNSYRLENGSYFRNKMVMVGYTFPGKWLQKMKLERIRIYVQAVNLFTITRYTGLDPELPVTPGSTSSFGVDFGNYPNNQKQYLIGFNIVL